MEKMKGISVRVDPRDLADIDKMIEARSYLTRSDLINAGIKMMLAADKAGLKDKFLRFQPRWGDVVDKFEFQYHREHR